jgi:hypothetical protein
VKNGHELAVIISGCSRVVDPEKIHALAAWSLKCEHDTKKIRIGFHVRRAQPGRDSANAAVLRGRLKKPDTTQRFGQIVRDLENNPAASELELMRHTIWEFEIRIVGQKFSLDVGNLCYVLANSFQVRSAGPKWAPLIFATGIFQNVFKNSISARLSVSDKSLPK